MSTISVEEQRTYSKLNCNGEFLNGLFSSSFEVLVCVFVQPALCNLVSTFGE